jgi:hypothetical protein
MSTKSKIEGYGYGVQISEENKKYIEERTKLIPYAEASTEMEIRLKDYKNADDYKQAWTNYFLNKMDELCFDYNLVLNKPLSRRS